MMRKKVFYLLAIVVVARLIAPSPVRAYLDPGTSSYVFQILIAGLLGSAFFFRSIIAKVKGFFKSRESSVEGVEGDED